MEKKLNIKNPISWNFHRSGWKYVVENLKKNFHNPNGIYLTTHFETDVAKKSPIRKPWVGFLHNVPDHPEIMKCYGAYNNGLRAILKSKVWADSKKNCQGLFVFSSYIKDWVEKNMFECVETFFHPTEFTNIKFDLKKFLSIKEKKIISIGHWMRNFESFYNIETNFQKIMLVTPYHKIKLDNPNITYLKQIKNADYDKTLEESIVFVDLYDASANNVVIECLVRNTPLLINKLPATAEYLGEEYPFYFSNLEEASNKLSNKDLIIKTHEYLKNKNKDFLEIKNFIKTFANCEIYKKIKIHKFF